MPQPIYVVDAFTSEPFGGNPAGVCPLESPMSEEAMRAVAMEMNHAETAFVSRRDDGDWDLRWFTPVCEVALCGHATLASAHLLWSTDRAQGEIRFHTASGVLTASPSSDGGIELDFPAEVAWEIAPDDLIREILGAAPVWFGRNRMDFLAVVESEAAVRELVPDMEKVRQLGERGLMVTAESFSNDYEFVSRFFAPSFGVDEDSVTGSAHCCLGPYWAERLERTKLRGFQASKRGGSVSVEVVGDRVKLAGRAVTTLAGSLVY